MNISAGEKLLALEIRKRKLLIRSMRRTEADPDEILIKMSEMEDLTEKYNNSADTAYVEKIEDIANDLCDELYYELGKDTRDDVSLSRFYDLDAIVTVVGNDKYVGKIAIVNSMLVRGHCEC
jgi:hypothetical protein